MLRSAFILVALIGSASAQLNQRADSTCENAVTGIIGNPPAAQCLGAASLVGVAAAAAATPSSSSSIVPSISSWITNLCSSPKCSNDTLAAVVQNITTGCASELNLSLDNSSISTITSTVEQLYPTVRQIICLMDGSINCVTQFLTNIETVVGTISVSNILNLARNVTASDFPSNITCTDCNKAIYNEVNQSIPSLATDLGPALKTQCGASFIDGSTPSNIIESASNSTSTPTSSASSTAFGGASILSHGVITGLVVISALLLLP